MGMMQSLGQLLADKLGDMAGVEKKKKEEADKNLKGREYNSGNFNVRDQLRQLQEEENAKNKGRK